MLGSVSKLRGDQTMTGELRNARVVAFAGIALGWAVVHGLLILSASAAEIVQDAAAYFPDTVGSRWHYRGHVATWPLQTVAKRQFVNVSTVRGSEELKGVAVKVFHDTNAGNNGPSASYYRRDAAGIVYYGSEPGTTIEKQLVPYQLVRFPMKIPSSFQQFDRKELNFGEDLDSDGENERLDVQASVNVIGREAVTVPSGSYPAAIKIEARMVMRIHLSHNNRIVVGTDTLIAWFAKGVGLVKYVERQELPPFKSDRGIASEILEELEEVQIQPETALFRGRESPSQGIFADNTADQELAHIVLTSGFSPDTR